MSSVSEQERGLILGLLLGRVSEAEFLQKYPANGVEPRFLGLFMLRRSLEERDPVGVEFGLYLAHRFGISPDYQDVLIALADADWHERHEDVVDGLAKLKAPPSVDVLYRAALAEYPYRSYDDTNALASKSIRALGSIETQEAIRMLSELGHRGTPELQSQVRSQLRTIERNGSLPVALRTAAHEALRAASWADER